ncbi:uncharacterized protein [Littorina saxatilis]|uniref:G-protein coupled receptors family 1 profile domain-containing protein n=1 Tax=Littorina saxatilis TaxID=31220 RepID=A0AAN9ARM9_9CAEN
MAVNHHSRMGRALLNETAAASKLCADNFTLAYELNKEMIPYQAPAVALMALMMPVGTISNALVLYIYPTYFKKTSTYYFILCLACYDLFVCVFVLPLNIYMAMHNLDYNNTMLCKIHRLVENTAVIASALILVVVAGDRYIKIYYPFYYLSGKKIKGICAAIGVATFILNVPPAVMLFGIMRPDTRIKGFRGYRCDMQEDIRNSMGVTAFYGALAALFVLILVLLCYLYGKVWLYIRQRQKVAIGETIKPVMMERLKKMANDKLRHIEEHLDDAEDVSSDTLTVKHNLVRTSQRRATDTEELPTSKFNSSICRSVLTSVKEHAIIRPYPPPSHPVRKSSSAAHNAYLDLALPLRNKQAPRAGQNAVNRSQSDPLDTGMSEGDEHKHAESELTTCNTARYDSGKYGRGGERKAAETEIEARETKVSSATDSIPDFIERAREAGREGALPIPITPALSRPSTSKPLRTDLAVTTVKNNDITAHPPTPEVSKRRDNATIDEDPERRRLSQEVERKALQSSPIAQTDSKEDMTPAAELSGDFSKPRKPKGATDPAAGFSHRRSARFSLPPPQTRLGSLSIVSRRLSSPLRFAKKLTAKLLKPLSRTTISLVAVTVIFFLCYIFPVLILPFSNYSSQPGCVEHVVTTLLVKVRFLQNVVNPFVYAFFQLSFREHISELFQALLCRCGKSRVGNLSRTNQATGHTTKVTEASGNPSRMNQPTDA